MNKGESNDVNKVIQWVTGTAPQGRGVTREQALEAAVRLTGRAHTTLAAGLTPELVRNNWPAAPSDRAATARIAVLEAAAVAGYELAFDEVPEEPAGLEDWYTENLTGIVDEIRARRGGGRD